MKNDCPVIFYKYPNLGPDMETWLPKLLLGESLKFSSRVAFNDPFDCRPAYRISAGTPAGKAYIRDRLKSSGLTPAQRILAGARVQEQSRQPRSFGMITEIDRILDEIGVLSLADAWNSMLMWSHYANHHKGICIGFKCDVDVFRLALPVHYQAQLPFIRRPEDDNGVMLDKTFFTKADCWAYEQEWRIIKRKMTAEEKRSEALVHEYGSRQLPWPVGVNYLGR